MYFRLILLVALNVVSFFLTAQNLHLLQDLPNGLECGKAVVQQKIEELELVEQHCTGTIEENRTRKKNTAVDLRPVSGGEMVQHAWYTLSYSEENEQAMWVYYKLTEEMLKGATPRTDDFRSDRSVSTLSAHPDDYKGCGYDRGHLCPAGDMTINRVAMSETFYMSNMSPQVPSFNRGIWKKLEATVRNWANVEKEIHVVTGPVFKDNYGVLPNCNVTIPGYFYKVVFDPLDEPKMIGLVLPNGRGKKQLSEYVVTVNYIEALTGVDFFEALPDSLENRLEASSNTLLWDFGEYKGSAREVHSSMRCKGISKSTGKRCQNKTFSAGGYCHLHQSQADDN